MKKKVIKNESEFKLWFMKNYKRLGYLDIIRKDIGKCPDFVMLKNNNQFNVELETVASNFLKHKHPLDKVDEVVCIVNDIGLEKPVIVAEDLEFKGSSKIKVTLSINNKVYSEFQKYCENNAIMLSKRLELEMEKIIKKGVNKDE
jgi:hypothetical protein